MVARSSSTRCKSAASITRGSVSERNPLFLSEIGFRLGKLGPIGTHATDLGKCGVERLRSRHVADCLRGAGGTKKTVKAVGRILQDRFVFGEGRRGTL